jgi:hypothetical protein
MMCAKGARLWAVIPFEHFWFSSRKISSLLEHGRRQLDLLAHPHEQKGNNMNFKDNPN